MSRELALASLLLHLANENIVRQRLLRRRQPEATARLKAAAR